jgi:hypothetical protein
MPMQTPPLLMAAEDRRPLMHAHVRHDAGPRTAQNQFQNNPSKEKH